MSNRIKSWEYCVTSIAEAEREKVHLCKKEKCISKDKPSQHCKHFYELYFALWDKFFEQHPDLYRPLR